MILHFFWLTHFSGSYDPLYFCGIVYNFFFISDLIDLGHFPFHLDESG